MIVRILLNIGASRFFQKGNMRVSAPKNIKQKYTVERIVGHEGQKGLGTHILYHVKWYGYPESKNTWEPEESLLQSGDAIAEYWRTVNCLKEYDSRRKRGETYKSKKEASKEFQRLINGLSSILKEDP
ncbi:hypothetical protein RvY_11276-2 [Ramazzottius varieornatus]|nr:hypothetical protein RvY_11276-2 [Ramazzottius varieornatus]